jgi:hypothetical protein
MGPFTETKWIICHGPEVVHLSELLPGSSIITGQPNCECYDDKQAGLDRAAELSSDEQFSFEYPDESLIDGKTDVEAILEPSD